MYEYKIVRSKRKTVGIQVNEKMEIIVRVPNRYPLKNVPQIVERNAVWIEKALSRQKQAGESKCELDDDDIKKLKELAKQFIPPKVEYYAGIMGVKPTDVKINSAKTRFGSCSAKNSLNFSYILMLYPENAINYVVIHELAHIIEHNHSQKFYNEIYKVMPNYKECEKLLKKQQIKPF